MKCDRTNHRINSTAAGGGFWQRVRERWLGAVHLPGLSFGQGGGHEDKERIKVWDRSRGCYRYVDLNDRTDPLWSSAYAVAALQRENDGHRSAA